MSELAQAPPSAVFRVLEFVPKASLKMLLATDADACEVAAVGLAMDLVRLLRYTLQRTPDCARAMWLPPDVGDDRKLVSFFVEHRVVPKQLLQDGGAVWRRLLTDAVPLECDDVWVICRGYALRRLMREWLRQLLCGSIAPTSGCCDVAVVSNADGRAVSFRFVHGGSNPLKPEPATPERSYLRAAVASGHPACLEGLLATGLFSVQEANCTNSSLGEFSIQLGDERSLVAFLNHGGVDSLLVAHALKHKRFEFLELLRDRGFSLSDELGAAADFYGPEVVTQLLLLGADPNGDRTRGTSRPLHLAVRAGDTLSVEALLRAGADVNLVDHRGRTALHWAIVNGGPMVMITPLTDAGADWTILDSEGLSPGHYAVNCLDTAGFETVVLMPGFDMRLLDASGQTIGDMALQQATRHDAVLALNGFVRRP